MAQGFAAFSMKGGARKQGLPPKGLAAFDESDYEEALPDAQRWEDLQEEGNAAAATGDWSLALRRWDEALAAAPANPHVLHEQKAQVYLEVGESWRAIQSASTAARLAPGWAPAHLTLARAQLHFGEPELALESMDAVLRLDPGNVEAAEEINTVRMLVLQRRQQRGAQQAGPAAGGAEAGRSGTGGSGGGGQARLRVVGRGQGPS